MPPHLVLFGALDRHNFGDLLFPHNLSKLLPNLTIEFAGLADRDLRPWGGHLVKSLASIKMDENTILIHCGGELLTCTAFQAAVMLQTPEQAEQAIAKFDANPEAAARWAAEALNTHRAIPYVASQNWGKVIFNAVGGVEWPLLKHTQQNEVAAALKQANWVSVRDHVTQAHLKAAGILAHLCPDPAVMVKECFDEVIQEHRQQGEVAEMRRAFPPGFIACQFSAEFGDDKALDQLARGLGRVCAQTGLGVVLFRAGAAPWHDQIEPYKRLKQKLPENTVRIFNSLHLWDICALIASSRTFCGSSLHGSIVAMTYGLPHVALMGPQGVSQFGKVAAYLETWEPSDQASCFSVDKAERALIKSLTQSNEQLESSAVCMAKNYKASQQQWAASLIS